MPIFAGMPIISPSVILFMVHVLLFSISAVGLPWSIFKAARGQGEFAERWAPAFAIMLLLELIPIFCALEYGIMSGVAGMEAR